MLHALVLTVLLVPAPAPPDDPLTGVWEGRGKGDNPMIPPGGFGFSLVLEARGEDEALATITMEDATAKPAEASFDVDSGELSFRCDLMGLLVDVELVLAGEELAGKGSAEDALAAVGTTFARENDSWPRAKAPTKLAQPALLAALGLIPDADAIPLVLESAPEVSVSVVIAGSGSGKWLVAPDSTLVPTPLWLRRTNEAYWFEILEPRKAIYLAYNRSAEDPARPMAGFMAEVFAALESSKAERLVLDLRHNSGGNSAVLARFVPEIGAHPRLAAPGSLRVLVGPRTYSSGMRNAQELREVARARLYGEPTGGKPNSYGEVHVFWLPRSGLAVYHSTKSFRQVAGDSPSLAPDVLVPLSSADYFAGVDPVLERALAE